MVDRSPIDEALRVEWDAGFLDLALRHLDGQLTPAETDQLGALLLHDDARRQALVVLATATCLLTATLQPQHVARQLIHPASRRLKRHMVRYAAAAVIVLAFTGAISTLIALSASRAGRLASRTPIATLVDAQNAEWGDSDVPTAVGSQLPGGVLRLKSGNAKIEFFSGARVTLTGPAVFGLNAEKRAFLHRGKLTAYCPPNARGFTVGAPGLAVVDLGTEFALDVDAAENAELRVIKGLVEASRTDSRTGQTVTRRLAAQEAMHVRDGNATFDHAIALDPASSQVWRGKVYREKLTALRPWRRVGTIGSGLSPEGRQDTALVLVFALPVLDPAAPIRDADLQFAFAKTPPAAGPLDFNVDLHFLGGSDTPQPMARYYFAGPAEASTTGAVPIQRGVMTPGTADGVVHLSPEGHAALMRRLQSLYGPDGRPRQPFVMLRLNSDSPIPVARNAPLVGYEVTWLTPDGGLDAPVLRIKQ